MTGYDDAGLISSYRFANGVESAFEFDENNRFSSMSYTSGLGRLQSAMIAHRVG